MSGPERGAQETLPPPPAKSKTPSGMSSFVTSQVPPSVFFFFHTFFSFLSLSFSFYLIRVWFSQPKLHILHHSSKPVARKTAKTKCPKPKPGVGTSLSGLRVANKTMCCLSFPSSKVASDSQHHGQKLHFLLLLNFLLLSCGRFSCFVL